MSTAIDASTPRRQSCGSIPKETFVQSQFHLIEDLRSNFDGPIHKRDCNLRVSLPPSERSSPLPAPITSYLNRRRNPLLSPSIQQRLLANLPLPPHNTRTFSRPRNDTSREGLRHAHETLRQLLLIRENWLAIGPNLWQNIESPKHTCDAEEQRAFGDVHALTDAPAGSERELVALCAIGVDGRVEEGSMVVFVSVWVELAWIGGASWVHVDGPDVVQHSGAFGD
jgi:hypothetical protein